MERGIKLFPSRCSARHRRRRIAFSIFFALLSVALIWPVYPLAGGIRPLLFGLPLSLAYIVIVMGLMFAALIWLYLGEEERPGAKE